MTGRPPQAGRITGPITRHPSDERPAVTVTVDGVQHEGREHARAMDGRAVLVHWAAEYRWVRAADVTPRDAPDI